MRRQPSWRPILIASSCGSGCRRDGWVFERLYWKGRRNRPLAAAMLALVLVLIGSLGYGVRTAVQSARREALAQKRAALAQRLGQAVQDLEWLVRTRTCCRCTTSGRIALLRTRMAEIEAEMRSFGSSRPGSITTRWDAATWRLPSGSRRCVSCRRRGRLVSTSRACTTPSVACWASAIARRFPMPARAATPAIFSSASAS